MVTLGLKGLPYFPYAAFATRRLIELLEHELSHFILSHILATGTPDIAFLEVLAKCRTSIKELEPCATRERENEDAILDNDGWCLGFQTLQNDVPFCDPFAVVTAQCRFNVCTRGENTSVLTVTELTWWSALSLFTMGTSLRLLRRWRLAPPSCYRGMKNIVERLFRLVVVTLTLLSLPGICFELAGEKPCDCDIHLWGQVVRGCEFKEWELCVSDPSVHSRARAASAMAVLQSPVGGYTSVVRVHSHSRGVYERYPPFKSTCD